jgi:hypothetical protein
LSNRRQIIVAVADHQIVVASGVGGRRESELARRVAAQEIALHHAIAHDVARLGRDTLVVEGRRRLTALQVRLLPDRDRRSEDLRAQTVDQKR